MLNGLPPFAEEEDLSSQIMTGSYEFDDVEWNDVSWSAKSLVSKLMCVEAVWRISLHVALSVRWLDCGSDLLRQCCYFTVALVQVMDFSSR